MFHARLSALLVNVLILLAFNTVAFARNETHLLHGLDGAYIMTLARQQATWSASALLLTNNFFQSLGNIWLPINGSWVPGLVISRAVGHGEVVPVVAYLVFATEVFLSWFLRGRVVNLSSAYITGISLALLIKPQANILWPFALGAFLAIASKYVLTYRERHLWNPSNFAIALLLLLAPGSIAVLSHQWGNDLGTNLVIWAFGLVIAWRARVLHVTLTYVACFVVFAIVRHFIVGGPLLAEIAPITGPMYQLFVFFMVTDPRTTVGTRRGRILVVGLVALVETIIRLGGDFQIAWLRPFYPSPPLLALAVVGPIAMWWDLRRVAKASIVS